MYKQSAGNKISIISLGLLVCLGVAWGCMPLGAQEPPHSQSIQPDSDQNIFEIILKGGIRYAHVVNQSAAIYNFRLATELEFLFGVAPHFHIGAISGVALGVENSAYRLPLQASNGTILNIPLSVAVRYSFNPHIALQGYSGAIFNLTGSAPLFYYIVGAQFLAHSIVLDAAYMLNINALSNANTTTLLPHTFRVGILVAIPLVLVQ